MTKQMRNKKYMLVLNDRIFYLGLLGHKMKDRRLGALSIYAAPVGGFELRDAGGQWTRHELAVVSPYHAHQVVPDCGEIINVLIEPDQLERGELDKLIQGFSNSDRYAEMLGRLRAAAESLPADASDGSLTASEFDRIVLGRSLPERRVDARIIAALDTLEEEGLESQSLAADIARDVGLSSSRFLHLFKEQTGVSFRNYRMWRRARSFLLHANHSSSLTDVALSLGYPDSSHFSHSIRKTFGLQPRSIRIGSKNLHVVSSVHAREDFYA